MKPWTECGDNLMRKELLCLVLVHLGLNIVTGEWIEVRNALSCPKNNIFVQTSLDSQNWQNAYWGILFLLGGGDGHHLQKNIEQYICFREQLIKEHVKRLY